MKIADSESIKAGEMELMSSIMKQLKPDMLAQVATKQLSSDMLEFLNGDMVISDGQIVYKMDFTATLAISVMFNRDGDLVLTDNHESASDLDDVIHDEPDAQEDMDEPEEQVMDYADLETISEDMHMGEDQDMDAVFSRTREFWDRKRDQATQMEMPPDDTDALLED